MGHLKENVRNLPRKKERKEEESTACMAVPTVWVDIYCAEINVQCAVSIFATGPAVKIDAVIGRNYM